MPIAQFTRAFYAMNKVLEDASRELGLGQRAAIVLLILHESDGGPVKTTDLVDTFRKWFVSSENTAAKDVSIAKGELFEKDFVVARRGIHNIQLTDEGRTNAHKLISAIERALDALVADRRDLSLLAAALSTIKLPRKPVRSSELKDFAAPTTKKR